MHDYRKSNTLRSARVLAYRDTKGALEPETPAIIPSRVPGGMYQSGFIAADNPLDDILTSMFPAPGTLVAWKPRQPLPDLELIADMLCQYAVLIESGTVAGAGHYLPEDIRHQAQLIGGKQ